MPFAIISPKTYDVDGPVIIDRVTNATNINGVSRRVQRTATLDQSAVVVDHGFSNADRTLTIGISQITEAMATRLAQIIELHARVYASLAGNVFECAPESFQLNGADGLITLLVVSKVN